MPLELSIRCYGVIIVLWQYIGATIEQKVYLLKPFAPILPLPLVQWCMEYGCLVKTIFAKAWAVAVVMICSFSSFAYHEGWSSTPTRNVGKGWFYNSRKP
jgi:hypothetical protein